MTESRRSDPVAMLERAAAELSPPELRRLIEDLHDLENADERCRPCEEDLELDQAEALANKNALA